MSTEDLKIAEVVGVHGIQGALRIRLYDPNSELLETGLRVRFQKEDGDAEGRAMKVARMSKKPGTDLARLWMDEISTRDEAESLRGAKLCVLRADLPPLAEDEFYLADLVGLVVRSERAPSVSLGRVEGVVDNSLQDLLEIDWTTESGAATGGRARTWLLPAVDAYLQEYDDDTLWVDLPEGLLPTALERALEVGSSPTDDPADPGAHADPEDS